MLFLLLPMTVFFVYATATFKVEQHKIERWIENGGKDDERN